MQFAGLSSNEEERFKLKQASVRRKPSYFVWIDGLGETKDYITSIVTETGIEESYGAEHFKIGWADIEATNDSELFYASGNLISKDAEIMIWAGFDDLVIPIFTGYVENVQPSGANSVLIRCKDNMGIMYQRKVEGDQADNDTLKKIVEYFCEETELVSDLPSTGETNRELFQTYFLRQTFYTAMKNICDHFFSLVWFDERGRLQFLERERGNKVSWTFRDGIRSNVRDVIRMADSDIVNSIGVEYKDYFMSRAKDATSIASYGERERIYNMPLMNRVKVSEYVVGTTNFEVDNDETAYKLTAPADAEVIDTVHCMLARTTGTEGKLVVKIYDHDSDNAEPGSVIGTSREEDVMDLILATSRQWVLYSYSWAAFRFDSPVEIIPGKLYWISLDVTGLSSGFVYWQGSNSSSTLSYGLYIAGSWTIYSNKNVKHFAYGSGMSRDVTADMLAFFKDPRERLQIIAPGVPQLQMMDEVIVDVEGPPRYLGAYVIEARRHIITPWEYTTVDALREA